MEHHRRFARFLRPSRSIACCAGTRRSPFQRKRLIKCWVVAADDGWQIAAMIAWAQIPVEIPLACEGPQHHSLRHRTCRSPSVFRRPRNFGRRRRPISLSLGSRQNFSPTHNAIAAPKSPKSNACITPKASANSLLLMSAASPRPKTKPGTAYWSLLRLMTFDNVISLQSLTWRRPRFDHSNDRASRPIKRR